MTDLVPSQLELDEKHDHYDYPITAKTPMPGHAGWLTPVQQAQVHQLRMMLEAQGCKERLDTLTLVSMDGCYGRGRNKRGYGKQSLTT